MVAIYPKMQSDSSIEDYTVRVAQAWQVGQKGRNNGAVLFAFIADHKMYLQVGYGLEGAIPDITAKRIISDQIAPAFRAGNFDQGLTAGVDAILAAARGEYKGTGHTVHEQAPQGVLTFALAHLTLILFLIIIGFMLLSSIFRHGTVYRSSGSSTSRGWQVGNALLNIALNAALSSGRSSGGGWSSSGGGGGGGGGGFSSGGGSFGGGGAGGSW